MTLQWSRAGDVESTHTEASLSSTAEQQECFHVLCLAAVACTNTEGLS